MPANDAPRVYFDHAATAPFDKRLWPVLEDASWANANSLYEEGRKAAAQLNEARKSVARSLNAHSPGEIVFTSGGTESVNMAVKGLSRIDPQARKTHVIVSSIEHHAVLNSADSLRSAGFKVDRIAPGRDGVVHPGSLEELMDGIESAGERTCLVCIQAVNNEIGTIQPVSELAEVAHAHRSLFFSDFVQALGKIDIDLDSNGCDACSFSAHKIGATKGFGALYLRRTSRLTPLIHGGGQESGLRSGTSNVAAACAFAAAVSSCIEEREQVWNHVDALRSRLLHGIDEAGSSCDVRPSLDAQDACVPHIVSLLAPRHEGEVIVLRCDEAGFAVSSGSACSSATLGPSHVLTSIGIPRDEAYGAIRLSFGKDNTIDEIDRFLRFLPEALR